MTENIVNLRLYIDVELFIQAYIEINSPEYERIVTEEWNADWEKDVEPNFVNLWKTEGEKKFRK